MRDFLKDTMMMLILFVFGFIIVSIFLFILLYFFEKIPYIDLMVFKNTANTQTIAENILRVHAAAIIILTIVLICVGWLQLSKLNKTSKADFLLQITNRYGSAEIIAAREIIQRLYRDANPPGNNVSSEIYFQRIADGIDEIRNNINESNEFAHLLNLLDFLESVAYFTRKKYITVNDIDELIGNSILFYYKIYKQWIYYRRSTYNNPSYYCEFESLVEKIESHLVKEKLAKSCFIFRFLNFFY